MDKYCSMISGKRYHKKHHIDMEPASSPARASANHKKPIFVIQKHKAKTLHYDLHLEIDGVLKSWAIPHGPSLIPGESRLAIPTDDHPVEYATFEGVVPKQHFEAGTIMAWDKGTFDNLMIKNQVPLPLQKCYDNGQLEIYLHGRRISGGYVLIMSEKEEMEESWLLIKMDGEPPVNKRASITADDKSILTGRTMSQIQQDARR